jgi:hypothetical protein
MRARVLEQTGELDADLYYVCGNCAHVQSAPEPPSDCEACRHAILAGVSFEHPGDAEEWSQIVLGDREAIS